MNNPDQFQTIDNVRRVASEAASWISFLNILSDSMEGKIRGYLEAAEALPSSPQSERLVRSLKWDIETIDDLRRMGPIFVTKQNTP